MKAQRPAITLGCIILSALALWQFGIEPTRARLRRLPDRIRGMEDALREMQESRDRYLELGQESNSNPLSFLEKLATEAGLNYRLTYRESGGGSVGAATSVKAELDGVTLIELKDYLYEVELCPYIALSSFRISRERGGLLKVSFDVSVR